MISRLIIKCENADQGCKAKVQLEHYKTHISDCDFVQINCMNTGCAKVVFRKNMYSHEKECQYRLVQCKRGCGLPVASKDASNHKCVEELKNRLQKLEDNLENHKKDSEMRLVQLENMVSDLQNRAQQDSSASDVDQEDDNSRDSPDDDDANDPDSDEDDYQSEGGAGDESGEDDDDDDDDNGSNNDDDDEDDYDQDSDGGNSRRSYESNSSVEYASDTSSYRDYAEYPREGNSNDGDSNDSMSVEEINTPTSSPPSTARRPLTTSSSDASQTRNGSNSVSQIGRDFTGWVVNTSRGTVTPFLEVPRSGGSSAPTQQRDQQVNIHTALNSANTRLPPPPPYRPTSSSVPSSSSSVNVVSVSTVPSRPGIVNVVTTSPGVSVVPTSPPEIKMQVSFQVISRGQATSTGTSTMTRANSGGAPLIPIQLYSPVSNTGSTPSTSTQVRANRSTLSIATVTSTQTRPGPSNIIRPITNTTHGLPIPLRRGLSQADARAALRPLATGSGSVIASRIPGTRRRRNVPSRFPTSSSSREHRHDRSSSSRHRSHSGGQINSSSTSTAAPANLSATASTASSSHNAASSHQVPPLSLSSTAPAGGGSQLARSAQLHNTTTIVSRPNQTRGIPNSVPTPAAGSGRAVYPGYRNPVVVPSGTRVARPSGEAGGTSSVSRTSESATATDLQIRALKRRHNDDSSSSDESDVSHPPQRVRQVSSHGPVRK
ncbi:uncharacterized protein [Amphiura filiformis]|uniref:uncharacterized protein n=1 Tax=Amphiura filiformis TaxID=82378 RepID=UPI003B215ACC